MLVHTLPALPPASDGRGQERWYRTLSFPVSLQFLSPVLYKGLLHGQCPGPSWTRALTF